MHVRHLDKNACFVRVTNPLNVRAHLKTQIIVKEEVIGIPVDLVDATGILPSKHLALIGEARGF